jgi:hypothetical protein
MINSDPLPEDTDAGGQDAAVHALMRSGAIGALVLAGAATAIVVGIWLLFYLLVFLPRGGAT